MAIKKADERIGKGDSAPGLTVQPAGRGCRRCARRITGAAAGHMTGGLRPAPPAFPAQSPAAATTAARVAGELHRPASPLCALPAPPRLLQHKKAKPRRLRDLQSRRLRAPRAVLAQHSPGTRPARTPEQCAPRGRRLNRHQEGAGAARPRGASGRAAAARPRRRLFPARNWVADPVREPRAVWADAASTRRGHCPCCC